MSSGGNGNGRTSLQLNWQNLIMTIGLVLVMVGGFWSLAYVPIQSNISDLKNQIAELRQSDSNVKQNIDNELARRSDLFLTQREHLEFRKRTEDSINRIEAAQETTRKETEQRRADLENKVSKALDGVRKDTEQRRVEVATKTDIAQTATATRIELFAEIKRLDGMMAGDMKRAEFEVWKSERDKLITAIFERLNRLSDALDSIYKLITGPK